MQCKREKAKNDVASDGELPLLRSKESTTRSDRSDSLPAARACERRRRREMSDDDGVAAETLKLKVSTQYKTATRHCPSCHFIVSFWILHHYISIMALRLISKKVLGQAPKLAVLRAFGTAAPPTSDVPPTVFDKLISLTIVDPSGARRKIPAMVGKFLNRR